MTANVLFLLAVREEFYSLVAVIMALYPASTIALAWISFRSIKKRKIRFSCWYGRPPSSSSRYFHFHCW